jgi:hypothetical protein
VDADRRLGAGGRHVDPQRRIFGVIDLRGGLGVPVGFEVPVEDVVMMIVVRGARMDVRLRQQR